MKEINSILAHYDPASGKSYALATVVRIEGSSYRRMGARILVCEDGTFVGGISGGCLEGDALKRARMAIFKNQASLITYDTSVNNQIGVGLGCNGIIDVLFMPIDNSKVSNPIRTLSNCLKNKRKIHKLITIIKSNDINEIGKVYHFEDQNLPQVITEIDLQVNELNQSSFFEIDASSTVFIEVLHPPIHIYIFGNQYDIHPLIAQIRLLGWTFTLVCSETKAGNYPFLENIDEISFDSFSAALLMSHSYETDKKHLIQLNQKNLSYVGLLGPKVRAEKMIDEIQSLGENVPDSSTLYYPVGLDLGANNPEEIALSIVSEIKLHFSNRNGQNLKFRKEPINDRI